MNEIKIEKLGKNNLTKFTELIRLFEEVFEMPDFSLPGSTHLRSLLGNKSFLVFIAEKDNRVVGGLTAYVLEQYYSSQPLAYIYDLAVGRAHQRQGIGKKLVEAIHLYCKDNGFEEVFVQADKIDRHAVDFYRSTKPTEEEDVFHFYYLLDKDKNI